MGSILGQETKISEGSQPKKIFFYISGVKKVPLYAKTCFFSLDLHLVVQLLFGFILILSFNCKHQCPLWLVYIEREFVKWYWRAHRISQRISQTWRPCSQEYYTDYTPGSSSRDPGVATTAHRSLCTYHQVSPCGGTPSLVPLQAGHLSAMLNPPPPCWIPHGACLCTPALFWECWHGCCWAVEPRSHACTPGAKQSGDTHSWLLWKMWTQKVGSFSNMGGVIEKMLCPHNMTNDYSYLYT